MLVPHEKRCVTNIMDYDEHIHRFPLIHVSPTAVRWLHCKDLTNDTAMVHGLELIGTHWTHGNMYSPECPKRNCKIQLRPLRISVRYQCNYVKNILWCTFEYMIRQDELSDVSEAHTASIVWET